MKAQFKKLSESLFALLKEGEVLTISFGGESSQFIRFSESKVRQVGLVDEGGIGITIYSNNRTCSGGCDFIGDEAMDLERATAELEKLRTEVATLPEDPYIVLPSNAGSSESEFSGKLLDTEKAADALLPAMQGVDLSGIWASGNVMRANANSAGQFHWFSTDTFSLDYSLITPKEKMVKATYAGTEWNQTEYEKFMENSIEKLKLMELPPKKLEPGKYRTYIAPAGVSDILNMFSWNGLSEASIQQGQSAFLRLRENKQDLSPLFSLKEDFGTGVVPRFNGLGELAPETLDLIAKGKVENTLISSRTAKEYGLESNFASGGEGLRAPVMAGGDLDEAEVLEKIGTGIFLSNLHYLNWSDTTGGRITGLTRYACFWVEDGKIVAPIETMRWDDSFHHFFGENLEAVGKTVEFNPDLDSYDGRSVGGTYCPGVLLKSFALTL